MSEAIRLTIKQLSNMRGDYITIKTFDGGEASGFEVTHQRELPKSAKLDRFSYDEHYNSFAIYCMIGKSKIKYYIKRDNT